MGTVVIITILLSGIFLIYRFSNRWLRLGAGDATQTALRKIEEGAFILDVRSKGEFAGGSFPGAVNIPIDLVPSQLGQIPKNRPIVVYCSAGGRSASARDILLRNGYSDVTNAGGLNDLLRAKAVFKQGIDPKSSQ